MDYLAQSALADLEIAQRQRVQRHDREMLSYCQKRAGEDIVGMTVFFGTIILLVLAGFLSPLMG